MRTAVFASGNGSNLQAIIDAVADKRLHLDIVGVVSNKAQAHALRRAQNANIPALALAGKKLATFERLALEQLTKWQVDCLVLAGFMRVLSSEFIDAFDGVIINIHPSLLPAYKGLNTHARVLAAGDTYHGCSVHFVTAELDSGAVIAQAILKPARDETAEALQQRVHVLEHRLLPRVLGWLADGRFYFDQGQLMLDGEVFLEPVRFCHFAL